MLAAHGSTFVIWGPPVVTKNHLFVSLPKGLADSNVPKFGSRHLLLARLWCSNWRNIPHLVHHIQWVRFYRACTKFLQITPKIQTAIWQLKEMKYKIFKQVWQISATSHHAGYVMELPKLLDIFENSQGIHNEEVNGYCIFCSPRHFGSFSQLQNSRRESWNWLVATAKLHLKLPYFHA